MTVAMDLQKMIEGTNPLSKSDRGFNLYYKYTLRKSQKKF